MAFCIFLPFIYFHSFANVDSLKKYIWGYEQIGGYLKFKQFSKHQEWMWKHQICLDPLESY